MTVLYSEIYKQIKNSKPRNKYEQILKDNCPLIIKVLKNRVNVPTDIIGDIFNSVYLKLLETLPTYKEELGSLSKFISMRTMYIANRVMTNYINPFSGMKKDWFSLVQRKIKLTSLDSVYDDGSPMYEPYNNSIDEVENNIDCILNSNYINNMFRRKFPTVNEDLYKIDKYSINDLLIRYPNLTKVAITRRRERIINKIRNEIKKERGD